jgi:decaprenylphospho-beta-D-erythro-pentofuranosid-2-ulose 2-reductase
VDLVVVAAGVLGRAAPDTLGPGEVSHLIATNFAGPAAAVTAFAGVMRDQRGGTIVVFCSVAGVRVRAANFVYGAAKAGLDAFCQGLGDVLVGTGVEMMIVRPGFVHTKMTEGRAAAPLAVGPDAVADAVVRGLERGSHVVWVPRVLHVAFLAFRLMPRWLWRRVSG